MTKREKNDSESAEQGNVICEAVDLLTSYTRFLALNMSHFGLYVWHDRATVKNTLEAPAERSEDVE